jgi:hypothetical protein
MEVLLTAANCGEVKGEYSVDLEKKVLIRNEKLEKPKSPLIARLRPV